MYFNYNFPCKHEYLFWSTAISQVLYTLGESLPRPGSGGKCGVYTRSLSEVPQNVVK